MVSEVVQAGWVPTNPDDASIEWLSFTNSGETIEDLDFLNAQCGPDGLTIGFWMTNVGKNLPKNDPNYIKGKPQVARDVLSGYLTTITTKYYGTYHYEFLNFPAGMSSEDKMKKAFKILNVDDNSEMKLKAEAQILALLLTAEYKGSAYTNAYVFIPDCVTGHGAFHGLMSEWIIHILNHYAAGEYMQAKNEADFTNNLPKTCGCVYSW